MPLEPVQFTLAVAGMDIFPETSGGKIEPQLLPEDIPRKRKLKREVRTLYATNLRKSQQLRKLQKNDGCKRNGFFTFKR